MTFRRILFTLILCGCLTAGSGRVQGAEVVYSWKNNQKNIALTFDDGPHPRLTREILDILDEYGIKATFFVIGQNVEYYGDVLEEVVAAGHEIGNHTYSHQNLRNLTPDALREEIRQTEDGVFGHSEYRTRLLRPPEGFFSEPVCQLAEEMDYTVVCWSIDTRDWAHTPVPDIVENILTSVEAGDIILFHDYVSGISPTPDALRAVIPVLLAEGYRFVTVSELLCETE